MQFHSSIYLVSRKKGALMHSTRNYSIAYYGVLIALAFILSWLESFLPNPLEGMVPGIKLGLANLVVIVALYRLGFFPAASISLIRVLLTAFTFGNLSMFFYSLAGAVISLLVMQFTRHFRIFSTTGVSIGGGLAHNLGQILVAVLVLGNSLLYYLPYLLLGGCVSGFLIGLLSAFVLHHLPHINKKTKSKGL